MKLLLLILCPIFIFAQEIDLRITGGISFVDWSNNIIIGNNGSLTTKPSLFIGVNGEVTIGENRNRTGLFELRYNSTHLEATSRDYKIKASDVSVRVGWRLLSRHVKFDVIGAGHFFTDIRSINTSAVPRRTDFYSKVFASLIGRASYDLGPTVRILVERVLISSPIASNIWTSRQGGVFKSRTYPLWIHVGISIDL